MPAIYEHALDELDWQEVGCNREIGKEVEEEIGELSWRDCCAHNNV
jgi:hypothetical protein